MLGAIDRRHCVAAHPLGGKRAQAGWQASPVALRRPSTRFPAPVGRMTGIRSCTGATSAFAVVVMIARVRTFSFAGFSYSSHKPANEKNPPSVSVKRWDTLPVPIFCHSQKTVRRNRAPPFAQAVPRSGLTKASVLVHSFLHFCGRAIQHPWMRLFDIAIVAFVAAFALYKRIRAEPEKPDFPGITVLYCRSHMRELVTLSTLGASLYIILSRAYGEASEKWAYGMIGTVFGYWLQVKPAPRAQKKAGEKPAKPK